MTVTKPPAMTVVVLAKSPVAGRVKTRLTPHYTPVQAAALATAALIDTWAAVCATAGVRPQCALDGAPGEWLPPDVAVFAQRGSTHGERIEAAFVDAFTTSDGPVLLIGMDTPQVTAGLLSDARERLAGADAVFGPATDGGWWAMGLHRPVAAGLIEAIPTSRADTGARQRQALVGAGLLVADLPTLSDVDTADDAAAVAASAPNGHFARLVRQLTEDRAA